MKKTWAALNYLWYLWAMKTFSKSLWQVFSSKFWIGLGLAPWYCGTSQSCDMLTALPSYRACSPWGRMEEELCACLLSLVSSIELFVTSVSAPHPNPPTLQSLRVFVKKSENNVALCFTRRKMNAWFSLVCSVSPLTASCWAGTDRSSSFSPLHLFWY